MTTQVEIHEKLKPRRPENDKERAERFEKALFEIREMSAKRSRVNMPNGVSLNTFVRCVLTDFPMIDL